MKIILRTAVLIALLAVLALPATVMAKGFSNDKVVFGGTYTLKSGNTLDGDLMVIGGVATLEENSKVIGNIAMLGGTVDANGDIYGDIVAVGGLVELNARAVVRGNVMVIGAHLERAESAQVEGEVNSADTAPLVMRFPNGMKIPRVDFSFSPLVDLVWFMFRVFIWAAVALMVVMFFPNHTERVGKAVISQPLIAGSLGLLTVIVTIFVLLVLGITIILLPASLLGALLFVIAWMFGIIAVGTEVGHRASVMLKQTWPTAISAGVGTFVLVLVINGTRELVPCLGWILPAIVGLVGMGAVVLTRFGKQEYSPSTAIPLLAKKEKEILDREGDKPAENRNSTSEGEK
jgi:hypothetical protein